MRPDTRFTLCPLYFNNTRKYAIFYQPYDIGAYPSTHVPTRLLSDIFFEILYWLMLSVPHRFISGCSTRYTTSLHIPAMASITIIRTCAGVFVHLPIYYKKICATCVCDLSTYSYSYYLYDIWSCETKTLSYAVTNHNETRPYIHNNNTIRYTMFIQNVWNYNILYLYSGDHTNNINTLLRQFCC